MTDEQAFLWRRRLTEERDLKNLTDLHVRILLFTQGAIGGGEDQMSQAAVAEALKVGVRTVGDAYRRARILGLLICQPQYREVHGVRRRTVSLYRLAMPGSEATERHSEVRRVRRKPIAFLSSKPSWSAECAEPMLAVPLQVIVRRREELLARRWAAGQRF